MIYLYRLLESLNIFQQSHYQNNYLKWALKNYIRRYLFLWACLLLCIINKHFILLGLISFLWSNKKYKKHLVFTKRIWRLLLTNILITIPFCFNFYLFYTYVFLLDFFIIIANYINKPIERKIYNKFKLKAKKKLDAYKGIKIAIGGSYGKTSTKSFLTEVLGKENLVYMTENSYNTPMGISMSCQYLNMQDYFICEMGASHINDIDELMDMVNPDITILTSIGTQHLKTFKSIENIKKEKQKMYRLLDYNKTAFAYYDTVEEPYECNIITYGEKGLYHMENNYKQEFDVYYEDIFIGHYSTKVIGKHNLNNLLGVIAICDYLGVKIDLCNVENFKHRLSVQKYDTFTMIDDSFNANIEGAKNAIDCLLDYEERYIITPGFVELGNLQNEHHKMLEEYIYEKNVIPLIVGKNFQIEKGFFFSTFKEAFACFMKTHKKGAVLLIENDLPDNWG